MKFLGILMTFLGYLLVYAAVAKRGAFAVHPWLGLFTDAYTNQPTAGTTTPPAQPSAPKIVPGPAPVRKRTISG